MRVLGVARPQLQADQKCYTLGYNQGYANLSTMHYLAVKNTAHKGDCCNLCLRDARCVAWTRVAGARRSPCQGVSRALPQASRGPHAG